MSVSSARCPEKELLRYMNPDWSLQSKPEVYSDYDHQKEKVYWSRAPTKEAPMIPFYPRSFPHQPPNLSPNHATCAAPGTICRNRTTQLKVGGMRIASQFCRFHACRRIEGGAACRNAKFPAAVVCADREYLRQAQGRLADEVTCQI